MRWPEKETDLTIEEKVLQMQIGRVWRAELDDEIIAQVAQTIGEIGEDAP